MTKPLSVLIVCNDAPLSVMLSEMMRELRTKQVRIAGSLDVAERELRSQHFDVLLIGEMHEWLLGQDVVRLVRQDQKGPNRGMPILAALASRDGESEIRALAAGVDDVIYLPFTTEMLRAAVNNMAGRRRPYVETQSYFGPDRRGENR